MSKIKIADMRRQLTKLSEDTGINEKRLNETLDNFINDYGRNPNYEILADESVIDLNEYIEQIEVYGIESTNPFDNDSGAYYKRQFEEMYLLQLFC